MEDVTDFSWSSTKTAHAVFLCEMERGCLNWNDTAAHINRIRRARAQKHSNKNGQNWGNKSDYNKKHWFC